MLQNIDPCHQDVFVGFATVPGFVSFTSGSGSPYLQALAQVLGAGTAAMDLSDIHLIVKRQLANTKLAGGNRFEFIKTQINWNFSFLDRVQKRDPVCFTSFFFQSTQEVTRAV